MEKNKKLVVSYLLNIILAVGLLVLMIHYGTFGAISNRVASFTGNSSEWTPSTYYLINKDVFDEYEDGGGVVLLGDSITNINEWNEAIPNVDIKSRGIEGDTTQGVLNRLDNIIDLNPDKVFILIGVNDISQGITTETIINNYSEIVETLKSQLPNTEIYIESVLPVVEDLYTETYGRTIENHVIKEVNSELEILAKESNLTYIDTYTKFLEDEQMDTKYTRDGLHLNGEGYRLLESILKEYL